MSLHRRTFLNTAAVAAATSIPGCMAVAPAAASICKTAPYLPSQDEADPLLGLLTRYERELARFNATADLPDADVMALIEATYGAPFDELRLAPPQPTTFAGARAGIELVLQELSNHLDSDANKAVLRACASFLRSLS